MGLGAYFVPDPRKVQPIALYRRELWYEAYMETLFEYDPGRVSARMQRAEELIRSRQRELLAAPSTAQERRALKEALHALQALQACLQH